MTSTLLITMLELAIEDNTLALEDMRRLRDMLVRAVEKREQQVLAQTLLRSNPAREKFIKDIMDYGRRVNLPMAPEHLRTVGEFLYDTDVLGLSPEQILEANRPMGPKSLKE